MNRLRVIPTSKLKKSASLQSPLAPMAATSTLYFNLFQSLSVKQRAWCWHDLSDLEMVSNLQATKLGKPSEASFWPLNYFNAKQHDLRTLLHIAMIYQSIVHCIACYSNLHTYTFIHAGYCRISCTSSNIYNIGILKCTCNATNSREFACCCQSINQLVIRAIKPPHDSLGEGYGNGYVMMDLWVLRRAVLASHPDAAQQDLWQGNQLLQFGELKDGT